MRRGSSGAGDSWWISHEFRATPARSCDQHVNSRVVDIKPGPAALPSSNEAGPSRLIVIQRQGWVPTTSEPARGAVNVSAWLATSISA